VSTIHTGSAVTLVLEDGTELPPGLYEFDGGLKDVNVTVQTPGRYALTGVKIKREVPPPRPRVVQAQWKRETRGQFR
jgi:hypothetical protein